MEDKRIRNALIWADIMGRVVDEYVAAIKKAPNKRPDKRYSHLARVYSISKDDFTKMLVDQGGACAVCHSKFESNKDTHVDHNHKTGRIRGLLCFKCNILLGNSNENTATLSGAIAYINKHQ
jgi:hypothetical protein